ncbi:putative DDE Tnp4 domain-containing protein [Phytophthora infestans]|uniref:Putative DDE Tnp4 domain-containing protein n=1 Tax=Phytophthora infestans TaxID=4787 RepID=A0A833WG76_PHYIN|nr:putative DDE Tnp4 domain-containing protein [Phytophthora infestans]KAF4148023.1 putative DDE Tnp4 domain-containing protein [Phytophthora infestans]
MSFNSSNYFPSLQRYRVSAFEALCIFLRRMAYPARLEDREDLFGRDPTAISSISNAVLEYLYDSFSHLLLFDMLNAPNLQAFASAIYVKGARLRLYYGAVRDICRPAKNQKYVYN